MEEKCVEEFESVALNLTKTSTDTNATKSSSAPVKLVTKTTTTLKRIYCHSNIPLDSNYNDKAVDSYKPATSRGSMSLLQEEEFETNSQHAYAEVVLDDETTTSGVLEAYEISSSNLLPPSSSHGDDGEVTSEHVAAVNDDNSSSTDAIQIIKVSSDSSSGSSTASSNAFYNSSEVFVINDDDDDDDNDDDDIDEELTRSRIIVNNTDGVVVEDDEGDDDDDDDDDEEDEDEEENMNVTNQSSNGNCQTNTTSGCNSSSTAKNSGVIMSTNGGIIFLETPVVEEQQHHSLHHHHTQMSTTSKGANEFANDSNVVPKRLSDEFSKDVGDVGEETPSSSSTTINKALQHHRPKELTYDLRESFGSSDNERMSSRLKNMNLNQNTNYKISQDLPSSSSISPARVLSAAPSSMAMSSLSDIESMDLIERRDFEHEQRLTGGIIIKTSSFSKDDVLGMVKSRLMMNGKLPSHKNVASGGGDEDAQQATSSNSRGFSSDSKCTYKDLSATPTSSRKSIVRLTKSTAKMNLSNTLSHHTQQQQQPDNVKTLQHNSSITEQKQNKNICPSSSSSASAISSSSSTSTNSTSASKLKSVIVEPGTAAMGSSEIYSNSNSNDSLISRPSSTCSAVTSKQTQYLRQDKNKSQEDSSGPSTSSATKASSSFSSSTSSSSSVVVRVFENGCSRTSAIQPLISNSNHNSNSSANDQQDDDVQPSTSSARCQYAPPPRSHRQVNASAQTNERYLSRNRSNSDNSSSVVTNDICLGGAAGVSNNAGPSSSRNSSGRRAEPSHNIMNGLRMLNDHHHVDSNFSFNHQNSAWNDSEENNSDIEEICTCHHSSLGDGSSHGGSMSDLNDGVDELETSQVYASNNKDNGGDLSYNIMQNLSISEDATVTSPECNVNRKRKYHDSRLMDHDYNSTAITSSGNVVSATESNSRKRIAYDFASTPRSSQSNSNATCTIVLASTPSSALPSTGSPMGRRTPRSLIPTRDNPPPELPQWLQQFQRWSHAERLLAVDRLIEHCEPTQVRHIMKVIEPQFQRDFISLLPRELALQVLSYLDPQDLLRAAQTCRSWRFLCDDNLLWKEKCRQSQILTEPRTDRPKRGRAGNMPPIASPWKAAYMRQHIIEMNWRSRPIRQPKVLKGHDEHVITCLQFSGNRIVSGSDDNTLKVWSAVTGRCLRTLEGHTGGVWSSQMSGNIIISGSTDRTLRVWDMETGQCVHTLLGHTSTVRCMHLHGNKVVSGSRDATLRVWDIEQGTCLRVLAGHLAAVRCVQYDGKLIVSGAYDYMVKIWHPERSECLHTLQGHTNRVYSLQFDGVHVVSGSLDTSIRVWDVETGNCKHTLMGHQSLTSGMELRENILVSGNADSTVKVWDITTGQCLQTLSGPNKHQSAVTCLQFNSRFVVTSSDDGTVKLWDVKTGEFIRNLVSLESGGSGGVVWRIRANDTKLICAVGSRNGTEETKLMVLDFDVEGACVKCS